MQLTEFMEQFLAEKQSKAGYSPQQHFVSVIRDDGKQVRFLFTK